MRPPRAPQGPLHVVRVAADTACGAQPFVRLVARAAPSTDVLSAPTYEQRLGGLIERAEAPVALGPESLDRVWNRLSRTPSGLPSFHAGGVLRWALVAAVLLVSGGVVGAELRGWTWPRTTLQRILGRPASTEGPSPSPTSLTGSPRRERRPTVEKPAEVAPSPVVIPPAVAPSESVRPEKSLGRAVARANGAPARSSLADESQLLGRALARLRRQRDARAALTDLDAYAVRFPSGVLLPEARRMRVDALLMEGRLAEARTDLSALDLGPGTRDRELRLIRAELVAEHACGAALADYQIVLGENVDGALAERALWGRAACLTHLGDEAGARRDLAAYVTRFPNGIHVAAAHARLRD